MSYEINSYVDCENIQSELNQNFMTCEASTLREETPLFDFLMSANNRGGVQSIISPGGGKTRTGILRYDQRLLESLVEENGALACTNSNKTYDNYTTYQIDPTQNLWYGENMTITEFHNVCRDNKEIFNQKLQKIIDVVIRKVATKTTEEAVALYGKWDDETEASYTVTSDELILSTFISTAAQNLSPFSMEILDTALMQTGYCMNPAVFSGTMLYNYARRMNAACCSTSGADLDALMQQYGKAVVYDRRINAAMGGNDRALVVMPTALQLVTFNWFDGSEFGTQLGANYVKFVVRDPKSGYPLDVIISDNCGTVSINVYAQSKVVGLPADLFASGDTKSGVKFVNKIKVTNAA